MRVPIERRCMPESVPREHMRKQELEKQLAKETGLTVAAARDEVDEVVRQVLESLRKGRRTELPGLGRLTVKPAGEATKTGGATKK